MAAYVDMIDSMRRYVRVVLVFMWCWQAYSCRTR
jgi:hypothetical protein